MALQQNTPYETPQGLTLNTTYWRWVNLNIDPTNTQMTCTLYAYINETAHTTGKQPIGQKQYTINQTDFLTIITNPPTGNTLSDTISNAIYTWIKTNDPQFTNATDI
jgi:hypothetical protein